VASSQQPRRLAPPQIVTEATAAYLESEDAIAAWIEDCATRDPNAFAKNSKLFASWSEWAGKSGEYVGSQKRFSQNLETRGFLPHRHRQLGRGFRGIRLMKTFV
jgi:putative DNA primase/helicase